MDGQPTSERDTGASESRKVKGFVEAFETAWARGLEPELAEFLPTTDHPLYLETLAALVRVDFRRRREQGRPRRLREYQVRFPALGDAAALRDLAAEEEQLLQVARTSVLSSSAQ